MLRVSNGKCVRRLGWRAMGAAKTRNLIAVLAIALTATLFTSLFTIAISLNDGIQRSNFRQVGGFEHGGFKYLTQEQFDELKDDPLIEEWGLRRVVGLPREAPFDKTHVEVGYSDANSSHWMFCDPIEGRLPLEGTDEAAASLKVLQLLGVEPILGASFTMTFDVDDVQTTQTFTLCGWWDYDDATPAHHVIIPESRGTEILSQTGVVPHRDSEITGTWNLSVMLSSSLHIERDLGRILENHGYQSENRADRETYVATGVNWGYSGAQLAQNVNPGVILAMAAICLLIGFTGYLIIYNVFQISVTNDIRFYGLLKTIGTTPRQIRQILRQQALLLSLAGIPLGLLIGWLVGAKLTPVIASEMSGVDHVISIHPAVFIASAVFALLTVLLSCALPGRKAAKVAPVEAVRYAEGGSVKRISRRARANGSLLSMAAANLGRSRGKTAITVASLSLAVVLLNLTVVFTDGFDMDKYVANKSVCDFIVANASYFSSNWSAEATLPEETVARFEALDGITQGGRIYGRVSRMLEYVTEDYFRSAYGKYTYDEYLDEMIAMQPRNEDGLIADRMQLSGWSPYALDHLHVLDGDISRLYEPGGHYIVACYFTDDYGRPRMDSHWARLGDIVTLRYVEDLEYYNPRTGEVYPSFDSIRDDDIYCERPTKYRDVDYEVVALVQMPGSLGYRYAGADEFILNETTFIRDTGTSNVMLYACDVADEAVDAAEAFLSDYTQHVDAALNYESKATFKAEFEGFRSMFLLLGGVLSFIVGLVGILNFFNAILTGILSRKREFAVLQSIGMTGKQLKRMLVWEGMFYALGSVAAALALSALFGPFLSRTVEGMFWFYTYHPTVVPILLLLPVFVLLGCAVPLAVYGSVSRLTIVERLREAEA